MATKNPGGIKLDIDVDPSDGLKGLKDVQAEIKATVASFNELKDAVGAARDAVATVGGRGTRAKLALLKEVGKATRSETRMNVTRKLTDTQRRASTAKYANITRAEGEHLRASVRDAHIEKRVLLKEQRDESEKSVLEAKGESAAYVEEARTEGAKQRFRIKRISGKIGTVEHKRRQRFTTSEQKIRNDDRIRVGDAKRVNTEAAEKAREGLAVTKGDQGVRVDAARGDQDRQTIESRARARREVMAYGSNLRMNKMPTASSAASELMRGGLMKAVQLSRIPGAGRWVSSQWKAAQAFPGAMTAHGKLMTLHKENVLRHSNQVAAATAQRAAIAATPHAQAFKQGRALGMTPAQAKTYANYTASPNFASGGNIPQMPATPVAPGAMPTPPLPPNRFIAGAAGFAMAHPGLVIGGALITGGAILAGKSLYARYQETQKYEGAALDLRRSSMRSAAATGSASGRMGVLSDYYNAGRSYGFSTGETAASGEAFYGAGGRGDLGGVMAAQRAYGLDAGTQGRLGKAARFGGGLGFGGANAVGALAGSASSMGLTGSDATQYMAQMVDLLETLVQDGMKVDARSIAAAQQTATRLAGGDSIVGRKMAEGVRSNIEEIVATGGFSNPVQAEIARVALNKKSGDYDFSASDMVQLMRLRKASPQEMSRIQAGVTGSLTKNALGGDVGILQANQLLQTVGLGSMDPDQITDMARAANSPAAMAPYGGSVDDDPTKLAATLADPAVVAYEKQIAAMTALADDMLPSFAAWRESLTEWSSAIKHFDFVITGMGGLATEFNRVTATTPSYLPAVHMGPIEGAIWTLISGKPAIR